MPFALSLSNLLILTLFVSQYVHAGEVLHTFRGETMGTTYHVKWDGDDSVTDDLKLQFEERLLEINQLMSTYDPNSELSRFNRFDSKEWFPVSQETSTVVAAALEMAEISEGAFDPTVGRLVRLWNFGPDPGSLKAPAAEDVADAMLSVGYQHIEVQSDPPALRKKQEAVELDLSAIAKGYGVDQLAQIMRENEIENYMVEIGGEVRVAGRRPSGVQWNLGIERPDSLTQSLYATIKLENEALATSGDYRNYFVQDDKRYSHTIDPRTGSPVTHQLASVSVVMEDCMLADAWATTLMVLGSEAGLKLADEHGIQAYLLERNGEAFRELASQTAIGEFVSLTQVETAEDSGMSPLLSTFLLSVTVFLIAIIGLAAGVILSNKSLKGSCGGAEGTKDEEGRSVCEMCTTPPEECDQFKEKLRQQLKDTQPAEQQS